MKHYGIADSHGIESFRPVTFNMAIEGFEVDPRELSMMVLERMPTGTGTQLSIRQNYLSLHAERLMLLLRMVNTTRLW